MTSIFVANAILRNTSNPACEIIRDIVGQTKSLYECGDDLEEDLKKSDWKIVGQASGDHSSKVR